MEKSSKIPRFFVIFIFAAHGQPNLKRGHLNPQVQVPSIINI